MKFTEEEIRKLFGSEAAEDESIDRLKEYYFKSSVYELVHTDLPLRILVGHKGIGKSATFKVSYEENRIKNKVVVWIRPDDIMEICNGNATFLQMIRDWKAGLSSIIYQKVIESVGLDYEGNTGTALTVAGKIVNRVTEIFNKVISDKVDTQIVKKDVIQAYLRNHKIYVYIDDLDRGWTGTQDSIRRISALLNAARDITNDNEGLCIKISLRSDVYFLVRTSDESTDKIEGSVIWYSWTQHQILCMLAKRILSFQNKNVSERALEKQPQFKVAEYYNVVFEDRFYGRGKWSDVPIHKVLASMIRRRPRDLVKLCILAARSAREKGHEIIMTDDWMDNFDYYSQERLQDTINEYRSELPEIERLLLGMKPSNRERHTSEEFLYTTDELFKKLEVIQGQKPFFFTKETQATTQELAAFLYKINFLVARKRVEDSSIIDRKYFEENKYLSNKFIDFGYKWEVHPAFRWALYPDAGNEVYNSLAIDNEL